MRTPLGVTRTHLVSLATRMAISAAFVHDGVADCRSCGLVAWTNGNDIAVSGAFATKTGLPLEQNERCTRANVHSARHL